MRAVVLEGSCGPEDMHVSEIPVPKVKPGWVLVKVHASGMNRSELILREYEADEPYINTPIVPGIECAGEVVNPSDSDLAVGQKVIAIMGGMGRSFDGGYAEYCLVPRENLFAVDTDLPWDELAAIPESWFTAYGSLVQALRLKAGESMLICGGTSALGIAALTLAKGMGASVAATTRKEARADQLREWGADAVLVNDGTLAEQARREQPHGFDCVLELIGPATLLESMRFASRDGGRVCMTGVLGGKEELDVFDPIKDIPAGTYLCSFFSNYPMQSDVDAIFRFIAESGVRPVIGARYPLDQAGQAHADMEASRVFGKAVLVMDE